MHRNSLSPMNDTVFRTPASNGPIKSIMEFLSFSDIFLHIFLRHRRRNPRKAHTAEVAACGRRGADCAVQCSRTETSPHQNVSLVPRSATAAFFLSVVCVEDICHMFRSHSSEILGQEARARKVICAALKRRRLSWGLGT